MTMTQVTAARATTLANLKPSEQPAVFTGTLLQMSAANTFGEGQSKWP